MQTEVEKVLGSSLCVCVCLFKCVRVRACVHIQSAVFYLFFLLKRRVSAPTSRFLTCFCRTAGQQLARSAGLRWAVCLREAAMASICSPLAEARV